MLSQNALKAIARLHQKKYRRRESRFLVEGARLVAEALQADWPVEVVLQTHEFAALSQAGAVQELAAARQVAVETIRKRDFEKLSDTVSSQGIAAVVHKKRPVLESVPEWLHGRPNWFVLIVAELNDPGNLGTLIRTAAWFGLDALVLGAGSVGWDHPKVVRASMGGIFHLPIFEHDDLAAFAQKVHAAGATVYIADQRGTPFTEVEAFAQRKILIIGHETRGVQLSGSRVPAVRISVPQRGYGESLNAAVAAAILMAAMTLEF